MSKVKLVIVVIILLTVSASCDTSNAPAIDFVTSGKSLDVKVQLDKKQATSAMVPRTGGSVSLSAADGSKFTLDVPAEALEADTMITMTAVKSLDGAPLDNNTPTAVQLGPSGLFFKEIATLTIVPAKEIPIKEQIVFGYEGDGQDYHLAAVDPRSKGIKIKLMHFSGAGVGSGSDAAWAANLMIQASNADTRLAQKLGEAIQTDRRADLLGGDSNLSGAMIESFFEQFYDQVVRKEMAAAELDCKFAQKALDDLILLERMRQILGPSEPDSVKTAGFAEKALRLGEIGAKCRWAYQIVGGQGHWQTNSKVCDIMKPFTLTGGGFTHEHSGGLSGNFTYTGPVSLHGGGTYTISLPDGLGKPGTMTADVVGHYASYKGSATAKYTLTPLEPCS